MEAKYKTTIDDYVAFAFHHFRHSRASARGFWLGWVLMPIACLLAAGFGFSRDDFGAAKLDSTANVIVLLSLSFAVIHAVFYPLLYRARLEGAFKRFVSERGSKGVVGDVELILTDDTLVVITETAKTEMNWKNIDRIEEEGDYTFIYVTPMSAAILPKHGFSSVDEYEQVKEYAKECLSKTRP